MGLNRVTLSSQINGTANIVSYEKIASALNVPMWQLFVSPEEVQFPSNTHSVKCPHCQHEFPISVNVELKIK